MLSFLGENTWSNNFKIMPPGNVLHALILRLLVELGHVVLHLLGDGSPGLHSIHTCLSKPLHLPHIYR